MDRFPRRRFLIATGALLAAPSASALDRRALRTVGQLFNYPEPVDPKSPNFSILNSWQRQISDRFKALGWVERKNLAFRRLYSDGIAQRLPGMAKELVRERVDVIWASTTATAVEAERATTKIPIVLAGASAYPVECGLIKSFAHPGGNVTGVAFFQGIEVQSKLAQLVREILPSARRLAWIAIPPDLVTVAGGEFRPEPYYQQVARSLGFELGYYECRKVEDFDSVFGEMRAWGAQAVIVEPASLSGYPRVARLAMQSRIPSFFSLGLNVATGGLLSYGPFLANMLEQTVAYVDRILRGARPEDLPVEMPNRLELLINQKTAKALGIAIPQSILLQADRVIE